MFFQDNSLLIYVRFTLLCRQLGFMFLRHVHKGDKTELLLAPYININTKSLCSSIYIYIYIYVCVCVCVCVCVYFFNVTMQSLLKYKSCMMDCMRENVTCHSVTF